MVQLRVSLLVMLSTIFTSAAAESRFIENKDDFTGKSSSYVVSTASSGDELAIAWLCSAIGFDVIVAHGFFVGDRQKKSEVTYRFNDEPASEPERFDLMPGSETTRLSATRSYFFTQQALDSEQVMLRLVDPSDSETLISTFDLSNFREQMEKLACFDRFF